MNLSKASKLSNTQAPQSLVHRDASAEVKKWIEEAHQRLEYFAGQPDQREAYEQELMLILDHNTSVKQHHEDGFMEGKAEGLAEGKVEGLAEGTAEGLAEGKVEGLAEGEKKGKAEGRAAVLALSIQALRASGLRDEEISSKLELTKQERESYLN